MAGFDWGNTQLSAQMPHCKINAGTCDFSSGSQTVDVPTTLSKVYGGLITACFTATAVVQQTTLGVVVGDISNSNITFMRLGGFIDEDAHMSYWLAGT